MTSLIGPCIVFDRGTGFVLLTVKSNELAHFINSAILDTATHLISVKTAQKLLLQKPQTEMVFRAGKIEVSATPSPAYIAENRNRAGLLQRGWGFLEEQAVLIETAFDGFDFLSSHDLPLYLHSPDQYAQVYCEIEGVTLGIARKHLDFLASNLKTCHLRKKQLMQSHLATLRKVSTQEDYALWQSVLYNEAIGLGQV